MRYKDIAGRLEDSARDFQRLVWPRIKSSLGGGELVPVELLTNEDMNKRFDALAGVDAWQIHTERGMRGIASRVQWGKDWSTFTIRYSTKYGNRTEYQKRMDALSTPEQHWLVPYVTIQAYVTKDHLMLLSYAMIRTVDLFEEVSRIMEIVRIPWAQARPKGWNGPYRQRTPSDGNTFIVASWDWLETTDAELEIWRHPLNRKAKHDKVQQLGLQI